MEQVRPTSETKNQPDFHKIQNIPITGGQPRVKGITSPAVNIPVLT
ncbi:hypothetical protein O185_26820 [Photorhabdus temperata J3]|uniref:Uncharacterized protein n=1 Tax=Photorhabdus temperata J3 TaxID=1389415 RepID=U7QUU0_PHOTE|nr:hypothetical protein O185_26820 [Photorhabdus temperata J3]